jgi:hypothetical protein
MPPPLDLIFLDSLAFSAAFGICIDMEVTSTADLAYHKVVLWQGHFDGATTVLKIAIALL